MKVTTNWLKQYVDFKWSPEELAGDYRHQGATASLRAGEIKRMVLL